MTGDVLSRQEVRQAGGGQGNIELWEVYIGMLSYTTVYMQAPHLSTTNCLVEDKLHRIHCSNNTVGIVIYPSTGETRVLTLRLTRALVLHHTPPTQRVEVIDTTGTVYTLEALLYGYLEHLQCGGGVVMDGRRDIPQNKQ